MSAADRIDTHAGLRTEAPARGSGTRDLLVELSRIDRLIRAQIQKVRRAPVSEEQFRGLFVSEEEVDALLAQTPADSDAGREAGAAQTRADSAVKTNCRRLASLARLMRLEAFEVDCLLICLASEIDLRYERLYAYLQDDVTKKRPSVDLVLSLLCPAIEDNLENRRRFLSSSTLVRGMLVLPFDDPSRPCPPLLAKYLRIDERIGAYLLGSDDPDPRIAAWATPVQPKAQLADLVMPADRKRRLQALAHGRREGARVVYLRGVQGSGRRTVAEALCREMRTRMLAVDGSRVATCDEPAFREFARLAVREATLQESVLYWSGFDMLLAEEKNSWRLALLQELAGRLGITFLSGEAAWNPGAEPVSATILQLELNRPDYGERLEIWEKVIGRAGGFDLPALASKFRFTPGQIRNAAATARTLAAWRDPEQAGLTMFDLEEACRLHSSQKLSALGRKIKPRYTWNDIVLPCDRLQHLREICNSMKYRSVVYDQWGFDRKLSLGKGLNVLFAGPSGTGKTMAAEIMARELELDLYKIDLSTVVSKYIGETEKNLSRIFAEAESSNAILFFDEADALFGKRSEVRDSHDRYANIEINYLLQKMEEHEGFVILATNFRKNMDDAFVRRLHFTVEFPSPNEDDRRRIWERIWPAQTPRAGDVDLDFMARRFEIAGGNIRNVALTAAFQAASDGGVINMSHLLHSIRREYQKMGNVVTQTEFE